MASKNLVAYLRQASADLELGKLGLLAAEFLVDFEFDGQAMAIPARDVGRIEAGHGLGLDDEVLDDFVERGAEVDVAIGVRRAVVEDVARASGASGANLAVEILGFPAREHFRLGLREGWPSWRRRFWAG